MAIGARAEAADAGIWIGFVGSVAGDANAARRFEDDVLELLPFHGAKVLFRGHRLDTEPRDAPAEFHVLWFPSDAAFGGFVSDPRRAAIIDRYGDVFESKVVVRLEPITWAQRGGCGG